MRMAYGKPPRGTPGTGTKTAATVALYRRLQGLCGSPYWLSGVTERYDAGPTSTYPVPSTGRKPVAEFQRITGRKPATCTWEYVDPTQPAGTDGVTGAVMHETMIADMIAFGAAGGIICIGDHWGNPLLAGGLAVRMDNTAATGWAATNPIPSILSGGAQRAQLTDYVTRACAMLARLIHPTTGAKLPVVWRPMHEPNSKSFWWASSTNSSSTDDLIDATRQSNYVTLFQELVALFNAGGADNVLWQWNLNIFQAGKEASNTGTITDNAVRPYSGWYPGDAYCDIVSGDYYNDGTDSPADRMAIGGTKTQESIAALNAIAAVAGKPVTLAECGAQQAFGTRVDFPSRWGLEMATSQTLRSCYGMNFWRPPWGPAEGQASNAGLQTMVQSPYCITLP